MRVYQLARLIIKCNFRIYLSNTSSNAHSSHTSRLSTADLFAIFTIASFVEVLWDLRRLPRSCFPFYDEDLMVSDSFQQFVAERENRQRSPRFL